ncbi:protein DCL, chloroplastic-like isoform X2 [Andrographis paniculata]|uniref:protein DCL, chloroplastic-like isoform X2 n=1 Tax=Andrographis paniculata TaxID=175694 RepID=UPI0021E845B3|nr:protein DCL, chloroplastic-like isoform X2 [Andrographis paniculata]
MASVCASNLPDVGRRLRKDPTQNNLILCPFSLTVPWSKARLRAVKTRSSSDSSGSIQSSPENLSRRPEAPSPAADDGERSEQDCNSGDTWIDWEDQIMEETVPVVGFVKMVLHSGKYQSGDKLSPEHEKIILERLLPYHPECEKKIGCGVDYITVHVFHAC